MKLAVALIGVLVVSDARVDEQKIKVKDLPRPMASALKARYPKARSMEATREATLDLAYSAKGKLLEITNEIAVKQLPKAVTAALAVQVSENEDQGG